MNIKAAIMVYIGLSLLIGVISTVVLNIDRKFYLLSPFGWVVYIATGMCGIVATWVFLGILTLFAKLQIYLVKKEYR